MTLLSTLPAPPTLSDSQSAFDTKAAAFLTAIQTMVTEINAGLGGSAVNLTVSGTLSVTGSISATTTTALNGRTLASSTTPTVASGFGSSPTISSGANTSAFQINVGTGGTASAGTLTFPASTAGWICNISYDGSSAGMHTYAVPTNATTVVLTNETSATGSPVAWPSGTILNVTATGS